MADSVRKITVNITGTTEINDIADGDWLLQIITGTTSTSVSANTWSAHTVCMFATARTGDNSYAITVPTTGDCYCNVRAIRPFGRAETRNVLANSLKLYTHGSTNARKYSCSCFVDEKILITNGRMRYFAQYANNPSMFVISGTPDTFPNETYSSLTETDRMYEWNSLAVTLNNFVLFDGETFLPSQWLPEGCALWPSWNFKFITPASENVEVTDVSSTIKFSFQSNVNSIGLCAGGTFPNPSTDTISVTRALFGLGSSGGRSLLDTGNMTLNPKVIISNTCTGADATLYSASTTNNFVFFMIMCTGTCISDSSTASVTDTNNVLNGALGTTNIGYDSELGGFRGLIYVGGNNTYLNIGLPTVTITP